MKSHVKIAKNLSPKPINMTKTNLQTATATTARQWQILSQLERKRWLGTQYINEQLQLIGFDVSIRTIQRDLNALAERFPIEKNNANPQGWRWQEDAPMQSLPHMNLSQAVAFSMVKDNLTQLLPPAVLDELLPWFDLAKRQLKESKIANTWLDRVRILSANQPLIPPNVDNDAKEAIYEALFKNKQLSVKYKKRGGDEAVDYRLNPLAIVQRGVVIYLLATRDDADANIRQFALHRFSQAVVSDSDAKGVADFDLDKYIETGAMGFNFPLFNSLKTEQNQGKPTCDVHLIFEPIAGNGLLESQLSHDQQTWEDEQGLHVTATLMLTSQLVWWLRGFGKGLRSVSPEILAMAVFENA